MFTTLYVTAQLKHVLTSALSKLKYIIKAILFRFSIFALCTCTCLVRIMLIIYIYNIIIPTLCGLERSDYYTYYLHGMRIQILVRMDDLSFICSLYDKHTVANMLLFYVFRVR